MGFVMDWLRRFCLAAALLLVLAGGSWADEPRRVLLLHSFGPDFSPFNTITPQFREQLRAKSPYPVDLYEASVQIERFGETPERGPLIDYLNDLFARRDLDLIVTMGAPATRFVLRNRAKLLPAAPLLVAASDARTFGEFDLGASGTACPVSFDPAAHIEHILQIMPDTTDIMVALGASATERFWTDTLRGLFARFAPRVKFHWITDLSAAAMVQAVAALPERSAIYYPTVRVDAAGVPQEGDVMLFRFLEVARAPVFTHVDSHFGSGIVGGPMLASRDIAATCAGMAARILGGEKAGDVKLQTIGLGTPVYDWRQLQRWGVDRALLPAGSVVAFSEPGLWEKYRLQVLGALAIILLQGSLISWLVYEHRRRTQAEVRSRQSMAELTRMNRVATAGELSASIAHEIGQPVTGMVLQANAAQRWLAAEKPDVAKARGALGDIVRAGQHAGDIIKSVHAMFRKDADAPKAAVSLNDLVGTVLAIVRVDLNAAQVRVETQLDESLPAVQGSAVQLQQVILNLVVNAVDAMRGVQPRVLTVRSCHHDGTIEVSVADTGTGIDPADRERVFQSLFTTKANGMGMGLSICRSIIEAHGGRLSAAPGGERGSIFRFELPAVRGRRADSPSRAREPVH
jgi:signal transduction histidine kinase